MLPVELMHHFPTDLGICAPISVSRAAVKFILLGTPVPMVWLNKSVGVWTCGSGKKHSSEQLSTARYGMKENVLLGNYLGREAPETLPILKAAAILVTYDNLPGGF